MVNSENQINVMLDIDSNIDLLTKHITALDSHISTMQNNINKAASNNFNQQKSQINAAQQKIKLLQSELLTETNKLNVLSKLKQQSFMADLQANHKIVASVNTIADTEVKNLDRVDRARKAIKDKADREAKRAEAKSWQGALPGSGHGTTFGHKFLTTAQYAAAGTAIGALAGSVVTLGQAVIDADLNMRTMSAVLGINLTQAKALDSSVRALGETYGGTTAEIEQVAISLGRAGVATRDITKATEVTLKMARLTGDTFEQSANAVISFQQVFGKTLSIEALGNKLAYVANQSRLSTQDIGTFSNYALAAAKDVGLTEDAVGGLATAFSNAGVNASTIGTQIRRFTTLLTDNSEAVTSFFNEAGVSQEKLALQISRGGADSNKAMMEFAKTIQGMDAQKFTKLTGQMDILAANSLALIRNNANNITKYMTDLQTGVSSQLESVKVITEAYQVRLESLWNSVKNNAIDSIDGVADWFSNRMDGIYYSWIDLGTKLNIAGQEFLTLGLANTDNLDKQLTKNRDMYNVLLMTQELKKAEKVGDDAKVALLQSQILAENKRLGIVKDVSTIMDTTSLIEQENLNRIQTRLGYLDKNKDKLSEAEKIEKGLLDKKLETINKEKEHLAISKEQADVSKGTFSSSKSSYESMISYASSELSVNKELSKETKQQLDNRKNTYNSELVETFNRKLKETSTSTQELFKGSNVEAASFGTTIEGVRKKLQDTLKVSTDKSNKKSLEDDLAVVSSISGVFGEILKVKEKENIYSAKGNALDDAKARAAEALQNKQEREAAKLENIRQISSGVVEARQKQLDLEELISEEGYTQISLAERKLNKAREAEASALKLLNGYKGTDEETRQKLLKNYEDKKLIAMEKQFDYNKKSKEVEVDKANLMADYKDSLDSSVATQEYRLGLVKDERLNEVEKLKLKVQQDLLSGKINATDAEALTKQIELLERLSKKKKDIYTFTTEYQRQIDDQETVGYNAMKAGITSLESGMMNFFDVTSEGWLDWHALASDVLSSVYKQLLEQLVIKQLVSGITMGIGSMFSPTASIGANLGSTAGANNAALGIQGSSTMFNAKGGMLPTKGYANGGVLSGGTGIRDDIYLGNVSGTQVFAMGGEFITRKSSVNDETKGTLDYINKTGSTPNQGSQVNVPVKINIENNTGQGISADMIESITKPNDKGEYEKVVNIVLKASMTDPRIRSILKGR